VTAAQTKVEHATSPLKGKMRMTEKSTPERYQLVRPYSTLSGRSAFDPLRLLEQRGMLLIWWVLPNLSRSISARSYY
jgi:hypothetical protein